MVYLVSPNRDRNFGAVLQATALQDFLLELGIATKFISVNKNYNNFLEISFRSPKNCVKSLFILLHKKELADGCKKFDEFVDKYQRCTKCYGTYQELITIPTEGDSFIVGSDQVWPDTNLQPINMLSFVPENCRKLSYAASMGKDHILEEKKDYYREFLASFAAVSIRESSAISAISDVYKKKVYAHIDPVLLFDAKYWMEKEQEYKGKIPSKYILLYLIFVPNDINGKIKQLKRVTGLPIVFVSNTPYKNVECDYYIRDAGPAEFLWLIHNSEGVVSSSFHGCVFSAIYRKPLISIVNPEKPARLNCLLSLLGIQRSQEWSTDFISDSEKLYEGVELILKEERNRSKRYFREYLNGCNNRD